VSDFSLAGYYTLAMILDCDLLRRYAETQSEDAFAELVRRHVNLVYSAAMRQVNGDSHLAQDVAQTVFAELARKAAALSRRQLLSGWLYTCTHFTAAKAVRKEFRRRTHELEAHAMHELCHTPASDIDWENIRPVLDKVMHKLKESDRDVILMRYFENRQLADIGEKLGLSEDAARKRVDRALEKLRAFLSKSGVTATALAAALSANAVQVAPVGLATTLASASLAGTVGTGVTFTFVKLMTMTKLQSAIVGAVVLSGVATPVVIQRQSKLREENQSLRKQTEQLAQVQPGDQLRQAMKELEATSATQSNQLAELMRLRNENHQLREQTQQLTKQVQTAQAADANGGLDKQQAQATAACINNLRMIDGARQQWALEYKKASTDTATWADITPYLKNAEQSSNCPAGGTYSLNILSVEPTCSIPGHALPR
jgi:RNA polymerase sigma factor (sigma-70 family)